MWVTSSDNRSRSEQGSSSWVPIGLPGLGCLVAASLVLLACGVSQEGTSVKLREPIVYGADDRVEYYESDSAVARARMSESMVALFPPDAFDAAGRLSPAVPSLSQKLGLCPGEPFEDQPAAAFCSGVLVDEELVLTAGHCLRLYALSQLVVAAGYYYGSPGELSAGPSDLRRAVAIVSEALDPAHAEPRLDYAFLRLDRPVTRARRATPVMAAPPALTPGDPLVALSAGGGVPMKVELGTRVIDARADQRDYFVASSDTSGASSGGAVFDMGGVLLGVLARGGTDFVATLDGCYTAVQADEGHAAEEYTYVDRAVAALCTEHPEASSLCRRDCGEICEALESDSSNLSSSGGCAVSPPRTRTPAAWLLSLAGIAFATAWRRAAAARRRATGSCRVW
jgi:hypothetical protein